MAKTFAICAIWFVLAFLYARFHHNAVNKNKYRCKRCYKAYNPADGEKLDCKRGPCPMELVDSD